MRAVAWPGCCGCRPRLTKAISNASSRRCSAASAARRSGATSCVRGCPARLQPRCRRRRPPRSAPPRRAPRRRRPVRPAARGRGGARGFRPRGRSAARCSSCGASWRCCLAGWDGGGCPSERGSARCSRPSPHRSSPRRPRGVRRPQACSSRPRCATTCTAAARAAACRAWARSPPRWSAARPQAPPPCGRRRRAACCSTRHGCPRPRCSRRRAASCSSRTPPPWATEPSTCSAPTPSHPGRTAHRPPPRRSELVALGRLPLRVVRLGVVPPGVVLPSGSVCLTRRSQPRCICLRAVTPTPPRRPPRPPRPPRPRRRRWSARGCGCCATSRSCRAPPPRSAASAAPHRCRGCAGSLIDQRAARHGGGSASAGGTRSTAAPMRRAPTRSTLPWPTTWPVRARPRSRMRPRRRCCWRRAWSRWGRKRRRTQGRPRRGRGWGRGRRRRRGRKRLPWLASSAPALRSGCGGSSPKP